MTGASALDELGTPNASVDGSASPVRPLSIAHLLPWPALGGVEFGTLRVVRAATGQDYRHVAFCLRGNRPVRSFFEQAGIATAEYDGIEPSLRRPAPFLRASLRLARELRQRRVNVVHFSDLLAAYHGGLAARLAGIPSVCHVRCAFPDISRRDRLPLRLVAKFIFVSRSTWATFGHHVPPGRGTVIYDSVELPDLPGPGASDSAREELGISTHAKVVGMVARLAPAKDYETLIRAAKRVVYKRPDVHFVIVGDHSSVEDYRSHFRQVRDLVTRAGLEKHFVFTGHRSDVHRMVAMFDISVLCTNSEGLPLVILEAMAQRKPVVATAVGGVPEILLDGRTGLLHPHRDDRALASALLDLVRDPALSARLGNAGFEHAKARFSGEAFSSGIRRVYREVAGSRMPIS